MKLFRRFAPLPPPYREGTLTIGSFDGLHRGHQALIRQLTERGRPTLLLTFEPLPREFFLGELAPPRLTRLRERLLLFKCLPLDGVILLPFTRALAELTPEVFVQQLVQHVKPRCIGIGDDFRFGRGGKGDAALLETLSHQYGFEVIHQPTQCEQDERISSTSIRVALQRGDFASASKLLGRPYALNGRVHHGDALGRQLGFPTANLPIKGPPPPLRGVYAVQVTSTDGQLQQHFGVANLGTRPTINGQQLRLEVHLLDWCGDLYGGHLTVVFVHKLRSEKRFGSLEELRQQLNLDVQHARELFHEPTQ